MSLKFPRYKVEQHLDKHSQSIYSIHLCIVYEISLIFQLPTRMEKNSFDSFSRSIVLGQRL